MEKDLKKKYTCACLCVYVCVCVCVYGFPDDSDSTESTCNSGDLGSIPELGRSLGDSHGYLTAVFLLGKFHV